MQPILINAVQIVVHCSLMLKNYCAVLPFTSLKLKHFKGMLGERKRGQMCSAQGSEDRQRTLI